MSAALSRWALVAMGIICLSLATQDAEYTRCLTGSVARDAELAYPEDGIGIGIGPIDGERIEITEMNYDTGELNLNTPDGSMTLRYESGTIEITHSAPEQNHH
ncbi:MAG: hypothetical protein R3C03_02930 [Pirellulaceae bacterium]